MHIKVDVTKDIVVCFSKLVSKMSISDPWGNLTEQIQHVETLVRMDKIPLVGSGADTMCSFGSCFAVHSNHSF